MSTRAIRAAAAMSALLAGACVLFEDPAPEPETGWDPAEYRLVPRGNLATLGPISAITSDGTSHWFLTVDVDGEYWSPDPVHLFRLDAATGTRSDPVELPEHWQRPTGMAWHDGLIWIHYDANSSGLVTTVDPYTGAETERFTVGTSFGDIDVFEGLLYLAKYDVSGVIQVRDLEHGAIVDEVWCELCEGTARGLAVTRPPGAAEPELWGGTWSSNRLSVIVDHVPVASAPIDAIGTNDMGLLTFHGDSLTALVHQQLYFFDVVRP